MKKELAIAELLGVLCGDGCLSNPTRPGHVKYYIYVSGNKLKDKEHIEQYVPYLFHIAFRKSVIPKERKDENIVYIQFSDKALFKKIHAFGIPIGLKYSHLQIPRFVLEKTDRQFAFIRGLFDTDGCVVLSKQHRTERYYPRIEISSKNFSFLQSILRLLKMQGFRGSISKKWKDNYRLEFPGFTNLTLWRSLISSSNQRNLQKLQEANKTYLNASRASKYIRPRSLVVERV